MLFNSYPFLLIFLPVLVVLYSWSSNRVNGRYNRILLIAGSLFFAVSAGPLAVGILLFSTMVNYFLIIRLQKSVGNRPLLIFGLIFNVLLLCFFKYFHSTAVLLTGREDIWSHIALPLGISFYTFQQIAYLVDSYRGEAAPCTPQDYLLFTSFFPKLVQGPIISQSDMMPQLKILPEKRTSCSGLSQGLYLFTIGLSKKVLVADQFGKIVDFGYGHIASLNQFEAILTILAYTLQLYFDFSGYCDMACGVAKMFGLELPQNFNSPYKSRNISDFWKRWHMTLTAFLTKYIYFPLGGNRKGKTRTYLNIMVVYLISGLWHGTGITFLVWGLLHGAATVLYRIFKAPYEKLPAIFQWLITFIFVNIAWVFFRADTMVQALDLLKASLFAGGSLTINAELTETLLQPTLISIFSRLLSLPVVVILGSTMALFSVLFLKNSTQRSAAFQPTVGRWIFTYILLMLSILSFSGVSTFLYSNF